MFKYYSIKQPKQIHVRSTKGQLDPKMVDIHKTDQIITDFMNFCADKCENYKASSWSIRNTQE